MTLIVLQSKKSCLSKNLFQKSRKYFAFCSDFNNWSPSFQSTGVFETGHSDFHKLKFTVLKQYYPKQKRKVVFYQKYKISATIYLETNLKMSYLIMI